MGLSAYPIIAAQGQLTQAGRSLSEPAAPPETVIGRLYDLSPVRPESASSVVAAEVTARLAQNFIDETRPAVNRFFGVIPGGPPPREGSLHLAMHSSLDRLQSLIRKGTPKPVKKSTEMSAKIVRVEPMAGVLYLSGPSGDMHVGRFSELKINGRSYQGEYPHEIQLREGMTVHIVIDEDGLAQRIDLPAPNFSLWGGLVRDIYTWSLSRKH